MADTQAGKGAIRWDHPLAVGGVGSTGSQAANALARDADVVIGIGTRYSDFTTASRTAFQNPDVRFVNLNVAALDAAKHSGVMLVADARTGLEALTEALRGRPATGSTTPTPSGTAAWSPTGTGSSTRPTTSTTSRCRRRAPCSARSTRCIGPDAVVVQAAGTMPGDLQMLWRAKDPKQYHVEYGFSCMGYEIAGALGIKMAAPDREVFSLVGDGSYLMMAQEIVTAVSENIKLIIVIVQNHGFASIGELSEKLGLAAVRHLLPLPQRRDRPAQRRQAADRPGRQRREPRRRRDPGEDDRRVPRGPAEAGRRDRTTAVHIETDPLAPVPSSQAGGTCRSRRSPQLDSTQQARKTYEAHKANQRT